ncbi:hypothetical protein [Streptomyces sp. NPDC056160]|uniref:hypothetical protein n=1 Tax=Streptomyces sp. NPDC056160 TaxID=3345731 RepID=UPI0035E09298
MPGGPRKTTFSLPTMKSKVPRWELLARQAAQTGDIEFFERLDRGEAGGAYSCFTAV